MTVVVVEQRAVFRVCSGQCLLISRRAMVFMDSCRCKLRARTPILHSTNSTRPLLRSSRPKLLHTPTAPSRDLRQAPQRLRAPTSSHNPKTPANRIEQWTKKTMIFTGPPSRAPKPRKSPRKRRRRASPAATSLWTRAQTRATTTTTATRYVRDGVETWERHGLQDCRTSSSLSTSQRLRQSQHRAYTIACSPRLHANGYDSAPQLQENKAIKIEAPAAQSTSTPQPPSSQQAQARPPPGTAPSVSQISGLGYPALHTSNVDVNATPVYPPLSKPLLHVDLDADLAEEHKLWRRPGEDYSDYFNYGFDEFTWETYRLKQQQMSQTIQQQKQEMAQMQQMMSGGMPGMPPLPGGGGAPAGAPQGPAGMNGMGGGGLGMDESQMQMMMQQMASSGMDPSQMDFATFMQMAGGGMGGPGGPAGFGGGGQQGGGGGGGGFQQGHQGGGRGGRGRGRGW